MCMKMLRRIYRYCKNIVKFMKSGGFKTGGVTFLNFSPTIEQDAFKGKVVLVTGGSCGIGYATVKKLVKSGANVIITGRREDRLRVVSEELGTKYFVHDIADIEVENYNRIWEIYGRVDILVNNAGISPECHFENCDRKVFDCIMETNFRGHYFLTEHFVKSCIQDKRKGTVVNVASNSGVVGLTEPYSISKHAIVALTEGIAKQYSQKGIRCNAVAPDVTISEITEWSRSFKPDGNLYCKEVKRNRVFCAEEIAEVICFLASDRAICVNGQVIHCDNAGSLSENTLG